MVVQKRKKTGREIEEYVVDMEHVGLQKKKSPPLTKERIMGTRKKAAVF